MILIILFKFWQAVGYLKGKFESKVPIFDEKNTQRSALWDIPGFPETYDRNNQNGDGKISCRYTFDKVLHSGKTTRIAKKIVPWVPRDHLRLLQKMTGTSLKMFEACL